jgi:hypothetical protein
MVSQRFFSLVLGASLFALAGCSGAPDADPSNDSSEEDLKGSTCGGIAGLACPTGYLCAMPQTASHPDETGTCKRGHRLTGTWNGEAASVITNHDGGATIQFSCGFVKIDPFYYLSNTEFSATGTNNPGPVVRDPIPATITGKVDGDHLTITVKPEGSDAFTEEFDKGPVKHFAICL